MLFESFLKSTTDQTPIPEDSDEFLGRMRNSQRIKSCELFAQIVSDIAIQQYGIAQETFYCGYTQYGDGTHCIHMRLEEEMLGRRELISQTARLRMLVRDLQVEDHQDKIVFDAIGLEISFQSKLHLYSVLKAFTESKEHFIACPDDMKFGYKISKEYGYQNVTEGMYRNAAETRKFVEENPDTLLEHVYSVLSKPYVSMAHYESHLGLDNHAPLGVSYDHLLKTICQEEGISLSEIKSADKNGGPTYVPGGYN